MESTGPALPWADNYPQHQNTTSASEGPNHRVNDRIEVPGPSYVSYWLPFRSILPE